MFTLSDKFIKEYSGELIYKEDSNDYMFEGVASSYGNIDSYGDIFLDGSLDTEIGKQVAIMPNHSWDITKAIGSGVLSKQGKKIYVSGEFIEGDEVAEKIVKLKKAKVPLKLSIGGRILDSKNVTRSGNSYRGITKAEIYEVSVVFKGANSEAHIYKTLNKENKGEEMDKKEMMEAMQEVMKGLQKDDIKKAEIDSMKETIEELKKQISDNKVDDKIADLEKTLASLDKTLNDMTMIGKSEKENITDEELMKIVGEAANELQKEGKGVSLGDVIEKAASTTTHSSGVKHTYLNYILQRIQDMNPLIDDVNFMSISDNSLFVPREMIGLPETGWVAEEGSRDETDPTLIDNVTINLYQLYAMPVVTNKLLGTNFVQYGEFLTMRVAEAINEKLSDAILNGDGNMKPTGILQDTNVQSNFISSELVDSDDIITLVNKIKRGYSVDGKFHMHRLTWDKVCKLKSSDGVYRIVNLAEMTSLRLLGRDVVLNDSMIPFDDALDGEPVILFGNVSKGVMGIRNDELTIRINDQVTQKGFTKFYSEIGVGCEVVLPEAFTGINKTVTP